MIDNEGKVLNLYQRISEVMRDIEYLTKDDNINTGRLSYKAITEEKVTRAVRISLIKNGLVILPIEQNTDEIFTEYEKEAYGKIEKKQRLLTRIDVKYKIINIDNPTEFEILASSGSGVDSQDKGVGKAMTYSYKYMLLRTFGIPTGEDPDKISNQKLDEISTTNSSKSKTINRDNSSIRISSQMLINIAKKKGFSEASLCKKYSVTEVKFIKQDKKKEAYDGFKKLPDKN